MKVFNTIVFCFAFFTGVGTVWSQVGSIKVTGRVINTRNQAVPGASISIEGGKKFAADADGFFSVNLEAGKYVFTFSATGYQSKIVDDIVIVQGADNNIDVVLEYAAQELEGVVVRSSRKQESTNALLSFQKNNTSLSSGLAADFIRRTPDKNTGEVLRRVSGASIRDNKFVIVRGLGDRYNSAFINGAQLASTEPDKKNFSFDVIPSQLIDNIVINKTATPDLTGEFAGGLVQVNTKDIPTSNSLSFGASFGFNTQSFGKDFVSNPRGRTDWLGFDDGQRKLTSAYPLKYSAYNQLSAPQQIEVSKSFNGDVYREKTTTAGPIQSYNVTWANVNKYKNGGALGSVVGLTYRNSKLIYPTVDRRIFNFDGLNVYDYIDAQNRYSATWGAVANIAYTKGKTKIAFKNLFNQLFDDNYYRRIGYNDDNRTNVRLFSSVLNQRSLYSSQLEGTHEKWGLKAHWNINYAFNSKQQPDMRILSYINSPDTPDEPFGLNNRGNNTNRFWSDLNDQIFGWNADLAKPFTLWGQKQLVKIGGGAQARIRQFRATIFGVNEPANTSLKFLAPDQIFKPENFKEGGFVYITDLQNPQDRYFGASVVSSGFIMFDNRLSDKVRIVWGGRGEYFEQILETSSIKNLAVDVKKFDFLPSVNFTYSPNKLTNIRLSGSRTLARPEFRELAPFGFFDFEEIASTVGNPGLTRTSIYNADFRYEYYPKGGELLSAAVFYKNFKDPIELRLNPGGAAARRQYEYLNANKANLIGFEAEFRKKLDFIGGEGSVFEDITFNGNVSIIFSEVELPVENASGEKAESTKRPLQSQSPYLINGGFQYDGKAGWNASLLYNHIGPRLMLVGNDNFGNIFEKPRHLVDFQLAKKILKNRAEIRLTVSDLLNQHFLFYEVPTTKSKNAYDASVDRIFTRFRPGTTFTLGFTYDLKLN